VADGDQAGLVGRDDELGAGGAVELAEEGMDVGFDGGLADAELVGDVGVEPPRATAIRTSRSRWVRLATAPAGPLPAAGPGVLRPAAHARH